MNIKFFQIIALPLFCIAVLIVSYTINYNRVLEEFESTAKSKEARINEYIEISSSFIELMTIYGENFFNAGSQNDSEYFDLLQEDSINNRFHMDTVKGTKYEAVAGNLTGEGSLPDSGIKRDEVNLALEYNRFFSRFVKRMPDIAWLYYTSENHFINMYPWVSSEEFNYSDLKKNVAFYTAITPQNNATRQAVWTPVYLDNAGKGLMVTLSSPIYHGDTLMGAVSLDLTTKRLGELINSEYKSYLFDDQEWVIAVSTNVKFNSEHVNIRTVMNTTPDSIPKIKEAPENSIVIVDNKYIYTTEFVDTPWKMVFVISIWIVTGKALLFTLPMLVLCVMLFLTVVDGEKSKKNQASLKNSLNEIKSYHHLLENAATHDFLTSMCNRRGLAEIFDKRSQCNGAETISFIIGDIDEFKQFNDTFGHSAGDRVLVEIARIMKKNANQMDVVCRWGGEEFIIMLYGKTYRQAVQIADKIRKDIENTVITWADDIKLQATMTFGVAECENGKMENCIEKADKALYIGKEKGRNCVVGYWDSDIK